MKQLKYLIVLLSSTGALLILPSCSGEPKNPLPPEPEKKEVVTDVPQLDFDVTGRLKHDSMAFTEGLLYHEGKLYESTGSPEQLPDAQSYVGTTDPATGKSSILIKLDRSKYFGEGMCILNGKIYQLTYQNKEGYVYDLKSLKKLKTFTIESDEGWGMTTDGKYIIMSDGSNMLRFMDPENLSTVKTIQVTNGGLAEDRLNELEYINGYIYANVWMKNYLVKIDPNDGKIKGIMDLSGLYFEAKEKFRGSMETNGIAYDSISKKILVTGKCWPISFELKLRN